MPNEFIIKNGFRSQGNSEITGSAQITGSLGITGSLSVLTGSTIPLNTATYTLSDSSNIASVGWGKRNLSDSAAKVSVDWLNRKLYGSNGKVSANWASGSLYDSTESSSIDYGSRYAIDTTGARAIEWNSRRLSDAAGERSILWGSRLAYDAAVVPSIDWSNRILFDNTGTSGSINWNDRTLINGSGTTVVDWENLVLTDPINAITSVDWNIRYLNDSIGNISIDWENKALNDSIGSNTIYWDAYNNNYKITQYGYGETQISSLWQEEFSTTAINNTSQNAAGEIIQVLSNIDPTVVTGDLTSLGEDGIWYQTDQASISGSCMLGICTEPYNKGRVFTEGTITVVTASGYTDIPFVEGTSFYGKPVYMRPGVLGGLTTTIPTTGYVRVVGHLYYNNQTNTDYWLMKFRPSNDWYVI